jgi:NAD+ synthase
MITNIDGLINKITEEVRNFTDKAVVGLSGGVDSLVTTCLLVKALGKENVITLHMPYNDIDISNPEKFNGNSLRIADKLGTVSYLKPVKAIADAIDATVLGEYSHTSASLSELNKGNSRARARMCVLYGTSHDLETSTKKRSRVIGTGNLSEDFIGYDTKYGDSSWDLCLIGELFKSEVYQLAEYFVSEGLIDANMVDYNPSAGLWEGQSDEEELGYSYNQMEPVVKKFLSNQDFKYEELSEIEKFVWIRHVTNRHKHLAPPVIPTRDLFCN